MILLESNSNCILKTLEPTFRSLVGSVMLLRNKIHLLMIRQLGYILFTLAIMLERTSRPSRTNT
jgi:hypothetical protein